MAKIVDLRQDRSLINSNFDGYKLSLDAVPLIRRDFETSPCRAEPNEEQYSLLHAELFAMQNLLQADPWARTCSYFVNQAGEIIRSAYDENTGRPESLQAVYSMASVDRVKGDYNYSMRFVSEKYCVLLNGLNTLLLLDTGDRMKAGEWKQIAKADILIKGEEESARNFILYDCRLDIIQEQKEISLALGRVVRLDSDDGNITHHGMFLHWAKWILKDTWQFEIVETLEGKGSLYYCAFEPRAEALVVCSNREFNFHSEKAPVKEAKVEEKRPQLHAEDTTNIGYTWSQTDDDLVVKFNMQEGKEPADYNVKCCGEELNVKCIDETLLQISLYSKVDPALTTWSFENNFLQITLIKHTSAETWPSLLPDGNGPKETADDTKESSLPLNQEPIVNLEAPIEECDFPIAATEDEIKIDRFHLPSKTITHTVLLGATPPLFTTSLRPGFPLALATRQDVDACLWLQHYNPSKPDEWMLRHEGNLHAFGYVQASKTQKKFMDCAPDLSYAIISESQRHIFLYKSQYDTANELRKRSGPQVSIGKQHLITLEDTGEVLGITTASSVVTLLTEKSILYLQIN